jgi:hypothetical protein
MPQSEKSSDPDKPKRQATPIEVGYEQRGTSVKTADARPRATVNTLSGGGNQDGPGRKLHKLK